MVHDKAQGESGYDQTGGAMDVQTWFGLSYASYFVMPRAVLQAMPDEWQHRFTALIHELNDTLDWGGNDNYVVLLRDEHGRFVYDPLRKYRHPPKIARKVDGCPSRS